MSDAVLDHLVVGARRLEDGIRHVADVLGVEPVPGGRHPDMGTHNAVLRLGSSCYLEVIAIDPEAPEPGCPRWFDLDGAATRAALAERPRLLTWVARSEHLDRLAARRPWETGPVRPMRRGELHWRIAFPDDGRLLAGGVLPPLIEWAPGVVHPAARMPDLGCALVGLRGFPPEGEAVKTALGEAGLEEAIEIHHPGPHGDVVLEAEIDTPGGLRVLA